MWCNELEPEKEIKVNGLDIVAVIGLIATGIYLIWSAV